MPTKTLLLVEDSDDDVFFFKRALQRAGIQNPLQIVTDGQQAIDYLGGAGVFADRKTYPLPAMVLLDLKLPYIMGVDVLKWIRQRPAFAALPVVVLTSSQEDGDISATRNLGRTSYLTKPPDRDRLMELITALNKS
jgi:CheY-like chemotaxis protein